MSATSTQQTISTTTSNAPSSNQSLLKVINPEDYQKWTDSNNKIFIAPVVFFSGFTALVLITKKIQLGRLLANPLRNPSSQQKSTQRWNFFIKHSLIFGTFAVGVGAYFKKEFNKYMIFKEYEKQVNFYMRWRVENQIIGFINEEKQLTAQQKITKAGKML